MVFFWAGCHIWRRGLGSAGRVGARMPRAVDVAWLRGVALWRPERGMGATSPDLVSVN
jgi:hypothetical protein